VTEVHAYFRARIERAAIEMERAVLDVEHPRSV
jgi:hypothetical protein